MNEDLNETIGTIEELIEQENIKNDAEVSPKNEAEAAVAPTEKVEKTEKVETVEKIEKAEKAEKKEAELSPEEETIGNIKISVEVVSTIAGIAASSITGVSCMYTSFVDGLSKRLGAKKSSSQGVKVIMTNNEVSIDLYIVVDYGIKIPELAWNIQESVKTNVEKMTGLSVDKVNIHIEGISFPKDDENDLQQSESSEQ